MAKDLTPEQQRARRAKKALAWDARESYAKGLLQGILSMLEPGDVVIDCGANLGAVSGPLADTGAIVHAFEPDPYTFGRLTENLAGRDNVILHNAAVGATAGTLQLMRDADWDKDPDGASVRSTLIAGGRKIDGSNTIDGGAGNDIAGHAFVVHAARDDYSSQPSGNAGARVACGVIRIVR